MVKESHMWIGGVKSSRLAGHGKAAKKSGKARSTDSEEVATYNILHTLSLFIYLFIIYYIFIFIYIFINVYNCQSIN